MDVLIAVITLPFVFAFGASVGSFLNVVIYRLPAGLSLLYPPSRCPKCEHRLGTSENIPVLGWIWLGGRCRWCGTSISVRYPLVEAATGLVFCAIFWHFNFSLTTVGYWLLSSWLIALSLIDLDTMTLPGELTKSGFILGLGFQVIQGWQGGNIPHTLIMAIGGAVLGIWLFDLMNIGAIFLLGQQGMGDGDSYLAAMIGVWLGWKYLLITTVLSCGIGALVGGGALATGVLSHRRQPFPFGPFLALAAMIVVFWGDRIIDAYLSIFFPVM
ncbi:peptidase A24A domain protein [Rippkaea orientalis PCC 8801]|uniref:Prepilin leader peptidase/N-methyltransferase n=1 Tax=Rippkaea orientalis (strain PCC 8801 / RF-1) TaxID=41431 RepID=B7K201_RIPO1|nr:A24 family peptidase [Rippkaea orientalis]ACK64308.1 peptidase A24A domain protein [Rippkaea orientalis PCC 8801]